MAAAFDAGVNFFDNAEVYANGGSEELMGAVLKTLRWPRMKYVVSTKFYWGMGEGPNEKNTLNRKYLLHAIERLADGACTSTTWTSSSVTVPIQTRPSMRPCGQCRHHRSRTKPSTGAPTNGPRKRSAPPGTLPNGITSTNPSPSRRNTTSSRRRVESEYASLYQDLGLGLTTWSPLASGLLTGKYRQGVPAGSRATLAEAAPSCGTSLTDPVRNRIVDEIESIARDLGCGLAPLAIAWCLKNRNVSSTIWERRVRRQLAENLKALEVLPKLTTEAMQRLDAIRSARDTTETLRERRATSAYHFEYGCLTRLAL